MKVKFLIGGAALLALSAVFFTACGPGAGEKDSTPPPIDAKYQGKWKGNGKKIYNDGRPDTFEAANKMEIFSDKVKLSPKDAGWKILAAEKGQPDPALMAFIVSKIEKRQVTPAAGSAKEYDVLIVFGQPMGFFVDKDTFYFLDGTGTVQRPAASGETGAGLVREN